MSISEYDLLVRAIYRAYSQDQKCVTSSGDSLFYQDRVHLFFASFGDVWVTLGPLKYTVDKPGFWAFTDRKKFEELQKLVSDIVSGVIPDVETEKAICTLVPTALDIIAEDALVEKDGSKASNNLT